MDGKNDKPALKELFGALDKVLADLENEDVSLEDSFELYKKGMELLKQCNEAIDTVEKKVRMLDGENYEF